MLLALVAGLAAAWLVTRELSQRSALVESPTTLIAVAAADLPRATTLRPELMSYVAWPSQALPDGATLKSNAAALEGRVVAHDLGRGEPLLEVRLAPKGAGLGMAAIVPGNMRAMTVLVNEVIGVAGFIHPDDFVDVIVTMATSATGNSDEIRAKIILQNVKVLAVGQEMVTQDAKPVKVPVVTLLVDPEQSERLALASTEGHIQLTLRSRADVAETATAGISPPELFGKVTEKVEAPPAPAPAPAPTPRPVVLRPAAKPKPKPQPVPDVVEVLRGDRVEERKIRPAGGQ